MPQASWHLDRRTLLRGAGMALALPWLEAMSHAAPATNKPRRFCGLFFGNGVGLPDKKHAVFQDGHWSPQEEGRVFLFTKSIDPLNPHRAALTILGALSHPTSRK